MASIARTARPLAPRVFGGFSSTGSKAICAQRCPLLALPKAQRCSGIAAGVSQRRSFSASVSAQEKKYTKDHEWVELSPDGKTGTIGISTYAAESLGDVVYVELPEADLDVSAGDSIGAVESVKSASDIMTPISGKILAANTALEETPGLINRDPEGEKGWLARVEIGDQGREEWEGEELMKAEEYRKFTEE